MTIPNLPTDNLYKFVALTGIFLFVFAYVYPEYKYQQISDEIEILNGEKSKLDIEADRIKDKRKQLIDKIGDLDRKCNCGPKSLINDSIITWKIILGGPPELVKMSQQIDTMVEKYNELQRERSIKQVEEIAKLTILNKKMTEIADYRKQQENYMGISCLIAVFGFTLWYRKTQYYQDKLLKYQYGEYIKNELCQSCGIYLKNNMWYDSLPVDKQKEIKYCKVCVEDEHFVEPELTFEQMEQRVIKRCRDLKFNKIQQFAYVGRLGNLERWKKKFHW